MSMELLLHGRTNHRMPFLAQKMLGSEWVGEKKEENGQIKMVWQRKDISQKASVRERSGRYPKRRNIGPRKDRALILEPAE